MGRGGLGRAGSLRESGQPVMTFLAQSISPGLINQTWPHSINLGLSHSIQSMRTLYLRFSLSPRSNSSDLPSLNQTARSSECLNVRMSECPSVRCRPQNVNAYSSRRHFTRPRVIARPYSHFQSDQEKTFLTELLEIQRAA